MSASGWGFDGLLVLLFTGSSQPLFQLGIVQRGLGGLGFGVFFATTTASTEFGFAPGDGSDELLGVIRPFFVQVDLIEKLSSLCLIDARSVWFSKP